MTDTTQPPYGPLNDDILTRERALELAAQCWCDPRTSHLVMEGALAEVFAELLIRVASEGHALGVAGE